MRLPTVSLPTLGLPTLGFAALLATLAAPSLAQTPPPAVVNVGVAAATRQAVATGAEFVGRVDAKNKVDIRARVTGELTDVPFTEGALVKTGDVLYAIEQPPFLAAVQQAKGALVQAQAQFRNASAQRQRGEQLIKSNTVSHADQDQRIAAEQNAQGGIVIADANLQTATLNLGYATITAPIAGRISRTAVTKGNLVGPDRGVLTSIVSTDPMYVVFPVSQREFLKLRQGAPVDTSALQTALTFSDGSSYAKPGKIDFVDVQVNRETDTVTVRAEFPNPDNKLLDGQLVKVAVQRQQPLMRVVVRQAALIADQEGTYVFVADGGKAMVKRIKTGAPVGRDIVVESGLDGDELVIVEGLQAVRPNAPVNAIPIEDPVKQVGG